MIFTTVDLKQSVDLELISNSYMDNCLICKYDSKNEILGSVCRSALGIDNSGKNDGFTINFASPKYVFFRLTVVHEESIMQKI